VREQIRGTPGVALAVAGLTAVLLVSMGLGVAIGSADLSLGTVFDAVLGRLGLGPGVDVLDEHIVVDLRLPRVVGAAVVGAGLSVCGAVLQSLTGNQLADPYILGMSGGAALGASVVLGTGLGLGSMAGGGGAGAHYGVGGQVLSECCPQHLAQLTQPSDVSLVDEAARIRGQVQEELGIAAH